MSQPQPQTNSDHEFLPQYSARAVASLEATAKHLRTVVRAGKSPALREAIMWAEGHETIASLLRNAVHLVLPPRGEIYRANLDGRGCPTDDECESLHGLPAPVTAIEYPYPPTEREVRPGTYPAPKRITLITDGKQLYPKEQTLERHQLQLFSIFEVNRGSVEWSFQRSSLFLFAPFTAIPKTRDRERWGMQCAVLDLVTNTMLSGVHAREQFSEWQADIIATVQCCHALRAGALLDERTESSSSRRRKFQRQGVGGFTYHVLRIPTRDRESSGRANGSHASPRFHVRRAHIRKLPNGALTFVRQCFVGDDSAGSVSKHYQIGA